MYTTSGTLLERLRSPADHEAWERFVLLYTPFLFHCGRKFGLQEQDAADVVQDVFSTLLVKLPEFQYRDTGSFRGWLKIMMLNKCRQHFRDRHEVAAGGSGGALKVVADDDDEFDALWESEYNQHLTLRALKIMEREFEPATWRACWFFVVDGRPAADVASELGISTGSVYTYSSRVLRRLRGELQNLLE